MPADSAPAATTAQGKAPPQGFGRGFVLDTWYFAALARDVAPGSMTVSYTHLTLPTIYSV